MSSEQDLTAVFAKLGAREPDLWAKSQTNEGIPQLERFLFLRQAWREVVREGDSSWIDQELKTPPDGPGGGIAAALNRVLAAGVDRNDLNTIVRIKQWRLLFRFCYLLEDPGMVEDEVADICWGLFRIDEDTGRPLYPFGGLHESVLETEPEGREMRPISAQESA